ncbi:MAG: hypothetical protein ACLT8H_07770 [Streptococcus parasanguinis]
MKILLFHYTILPLQQITTGELEQTTISFAFVITDEPIDMDTPFKIPIRQEATLKALQDAGISLTVVGEKGDKKTMIHWLTGQMVFTWISAKISVTC